MVRRGKQGGTRGKGDGMEKLKSRDRRHVRFSEKIKNGDRIELAEKYNEWIGCFRFTRDHDVDV